MDDSGRARVRKQQTRVQMAVIEGALDCLQIAEATGKTPGGETYADRKTAMISLAMVLASEAMKLQSMLLEHHAEDWSGQSS